MKRDTFYSSFLHCARGGGGGGGDNFETLIALAYLEARNFFYSLAGNVQNSNGKFFHSHMSAMSEETRPEQH